MNRFIQLHMLTSYPASNLNRDDTGRPKSVVVGNVMRLRVSSQALKRAWRTSDIFVGALGALNEQGYSDFLGVRTRDMGIEAYEELVKLGVAEKQAREWAREIAAVFGATEQTKAAKKAASKAKDNKADSEEPATAEINTDKNADLKTRQLAHYSSEERKAIHALVKTLARENRAPSEEDKKLLSQSRTAADIAMFGRMLADKPEFNTDAAVQVSHAFTVHKALAEGDYFTAVDDLNRGTEDRGAAHLGVTEYGSGVFYTYVCIDRALLLENLGNDADLVARTLSGLIRAMAQVSPTGKQNSFASRAYASYLMAELGDQQPRSLMQAFVRPIGQQDGLIESAIAQLELHQQCFDQAYGACASARAVMCALPDAPLRAGEQVLALPELVQFVQQDGDL